ncbi:MAG: segregation/condensation protein A [Patescibacteria group bacterium]
MTTTRYSVTLEQFSGPLDKLLELIEAQHLDITDVSLAAVTIDFLEYIKKLESEIHPAILADFLSVAAKLMLIKSKILLPDITLTEDEESDIKDLESRLTIYKLFAARSGPASLGLQELWNKGLTMYSRPLFTELGDTTIFYPPKTLTAGDLVSALQNVLAAVEEITPPDKGKVKSILVTLEEKVQELIHRFTQAARQSFSELRENKSKSEIVVLFLAILHLMRQKEIRVEQEGAFNDIIMERESKNIHE